MQPQVTPEDIARMRSILAQYDQAAKPPESFDLNKPPQQPYRHQEYPKVVYNHDSRENRVVMNEHQEDAHIAAGWNTEPYPVEVDTAPQLSADLMREAAAVDAQLKKTARKPKE